MQIRIEGRELPGPRCGPSPESPEGYRSIHVAVQRRNAPDELLGLTSATVDEVTWTIDADVVRTADGFDVKGRYLSGRPGDRFIYLTWGVVDDDGFAMFRRAKLMMDGVSDEVLAAATDAGVLVGRLGLTDARGNPLCAAVRPPLIVWSAATARRPRRVKKVRPWCGCP